MILLIIGRFLRAMEDPGLKVFVYGTLKPGRRYWREFCEGRVERACEAVIPGWLYRLDPGYPGLVSGMGLVRGYVLWLLDEETLAGFDRLEDYVPGRDPDLNEYNRVVTNCLTPKGEFLTRAWTYVMTPEKVHQLGGVLIESGCWEMEEGATCCVSRE